MWRLRRTIRDYWETGIDDFRGLARMVAIAILLSLLSFLVVQNPIIIDVRLNYLFDTLDGRRMRMGTALLIAALLGCGIGWLLSDWRGERLRRRQASAVLTGAQEVENGEVVGDDGVDAE